MSAGFAALLAPPLANGILTNGIVVAQLLMLHRFMTAARHIEVAAVHAILTVLVLTCSCALSAALNVALPMQMPMQMPMPMPVEFDALRTVVLGVVIATLAQFSQIALQRTQPLLAMHMPHLGHVLAVNCLLLAVFLRNAAFGPTVIAATLHSLGAALGFGLLLMLFAGLREHSDRAVVPAALRGLPIAFVTATILTLALAGLVRIGLRG